MKMLVIDSMHCILEGLVHYHCRHVLQLSTQNAATSDPILPVFAYSWTNYSTDIPAEYHVKHEKEIQHIYDIHKILTLPLGGSIDSLDGNCITEPQLRIRLLSKNLQPLKFVCMPSTFQRWFLYMAHILLQQKRIILCNYWSTG
jgi:hypothetical protein